MGTQCIRVNKLLKQYGSTRAVDQLSFSVEEGQVFGLLGPNGAGKSTTVEILVGLQGRDGGCVEVASMDPASQGEELRRVLGVQLQSPALFPRLTVDELTQLFASFYPDPFPAKRAIEMLGLEGKKDVRVQHLSGGQRQRLSLVLAIISHARILFLDEPTAGLDPQSRRLVWDTITLLKDLGTTIVLTTHFMDEAEYLCDEVLIIDQGKRVAQGCPQRLIREHFSVNAIEFEDPGFTEEEVGQLATLPGVTRQRLDESEQLTLYSTHAAETISALMQFAEDQNKALNGLHMRQPTLEDLFLKLTGRMIRE